MRITSKILPALILFLIIGIIGCSSPFSDAGEPAAPKGTAQGLLDPSDLSGGSIRVVWIREVGDGTDWHAATSNVVLMGYDSSDGGGVRVLHSGYRNYNKPLLSPDGESVIFTDLSDRRGIITSLSWEGGNPVPLGPGLALDVWEAPDGVVWVYAGSGPMDNRGNVSKVERFPLADPSARELVWDHKVARDNFQLDASGQYAGGLFPAAPAGGVVDLETKEFNVYSPGCWAALSPGNRGLLWVFDGRHRNLQFFATKKEFQPSQSSDRWLVNITGAPGIGGDRTYYPRWSNHSRFFGVSGPMPHGNYERAEIYVGRFSEDYQQVEAWSRITNDDRPDLFPDVLVMPGKGSADGAPATTRERQGDAQDLAGEVFETSGVLLEVTKLRTPSEILPYKSALSVYRYKVDAVPGTGEPGEISVAHWVIRDEKVLRGFRREVGETYPLKLELYDGNPKFGGARVVSDLNDGGKLVFVEVSEEL
tara:strand:+ start:14866 stop:16299 length:1434 start_codon:yes stop_codon:yes gene_type:complete